MVFHRLTFHLNGQLDADRMDTNNLDPAILAPFEPLFADGCSFSDSMPGTPEVTVKWTGAESGQALMTFEDHGKPFLSGVLLAGLDAAGDTEVLAMFVQSLERTEPMRQLFTGRTNPLKALMERTERPLLATVVWPTLSAERFEEVAGLDILLSAAFFRRLAT
jgi:hypothetical protein